MNNNFQRLFYIFKNMDIGVGYPTGYIKVEINCEIAKIQISLNNLLNRQGMIYQLYGIKKVDNDLSYTVICDIPNINGRADVKINVDSLKIGTNKISLDHINIFAIISSQTSNKTTSITCPLVAYKNVELEWKKQLETLLLNKQTNIEDIPAIHSEIVLLEDTKDEVFDDIQINKAEVMEDIQCNEVEVMEDIQCNEVEAMEDILCHEVEVLEDMQNEEVEDIEDIQNDETNEDMQNSETEVLNEEIQTEEMDLIEKQYYLEQEFDSNDDVTKLNAAQQDSFPEFTNTENDILSSAQKNFQDISSIDIDGDKRKIELNVPNLKGELDKSFESFNPFKMKSKSFKWWKINSPGFLNNILFRNNVKTYLLFNPKVMLAHYKYRYIIFGIRNDKHVGKDYFICGVPGVYNIDENPFGNMGSWAQLEGYRPKYGAFGYWIILIDPRTGKLLKIK